MFERVGNSAKSGIWNQQVVVILRVNETGCCNHCSRSSFSSTSVSIFHPLSPISCTMLTLLLSRLSTSAQPGSYLTMSTSSQFPKVENERTNTAESSSNQRSQGATASPAEVARAVWQSRSTASHSSTANTGIASQGRQTAATSFQPSMSNPQISSEGLQAGNTSRTERNVLQAPDSAEPGAPSTSSEMSFNRERQADTISGTVTITSPNAQGEESPHCSICFEILTTRSTLMPCGHEFDHNCIITWFQTVCRTEPWRRTLDCPLCRRSTLQMRHSYDPQGEYQIFDIHDRFRRRYDPRRWIWPVPNSPSVPRIRPDSGNNVASPGDLDSTDSRDRYVLGQYRAFIIESEHPDRLFLDIEEINRMGPHELEDLISDLRNHLSIADWNRFPASQTRMLGERICTFRSLSSDGPFERANHFPGYNSDDSLNINELSRTSLRYLVRFRYVLNALWELDRLSTPNVEAFQRICEARGLGDVRETGNRGNGSLAVSEREG